MKIIRVQPEEDGRYASLQNGDFYALPAGTAYWPDELPTEDFFAYNGFVLLTIEDIDGILTVTSYEPNIEAWEAWEAWKATLPPESEPEPTEQERLRADIDYIALMTGVTL